MPVIIWLISDWSAVRCLDRVFAQFGVTDLYRWIGKEHLHTVQPFPTLESKAGQRSEVMRNCKMDLQQVVRADDIRLLHVRSVSGNTGVLLN